MEKNYHLPGQDKLSQTNRKELCFIHYFYGSKGFIHYNYDKI